MISDRRGSNSTLFSTFIGSAIKAVGALTTSPPASSTRTCSPVWSTRRTGELSRMSASVACAAMDSISSRVPFTSFVAVNAAIICVTLHPDKA